MGLGGRAALFYVQELANESVCGVELHITTTMSSPKALCCTLLEAWSMLGGMLEAECD